MFKRIIPIILCFFVLEMFLQIGLAIAQDLSCLISRDSVEAHSSCLLVPQPGQVFHAIRVFPGARLEVRAGSLVRMAPDADVVVEGELIAHGTTDSPITFGAYMSEAPWGTLSAVLGSRVDIQFVHFIGFTGPIIIPATAYVATNLTFEDGVQNILRIGSMGPPHTLSLEHLHFVHRIAGSRMAESGVRVDGIFGEVDVVDVRFTGELSPATSSGWLGVEVRGVYEGILTRDSWFPHGCSLTMNEVGSGGGTQRARYQPSRCPQLTLPTIFLPGYGASINLSRLLDPDITKRDRQGWKFIKLLVPGYERFLDTLRANSLPFTVAYYDWRLPAEEIVKSYLLPLIDEVKKTYGTDAVNIVAHSYGGIVARTYIQGSAYQGDVYQLVQIGTPNHGAVKAYSAWEGAELPTDWEAFNYFLDYYTYKLRPTTKTAVVRSVFPSLRELLPTGAVLEHTGRVNRSEITCQQNTLLNDLNSRSQSLTDRVKTLTIFGNSLSTPAAAKVGKVDCSQRDWPDGHQSGLISQTGDGVVTADSVRLPNADWLEVSGEHSLLPGIAAETILKYLYPDREIRSSQKEIKMARNMGAALSFLFDCPVSAVITLPDGSAVDSNQPVNNDQADIEQSPELLWMTVPQLPGEYRVVVSALEKTSVRGWVNNSSIKQWEMQKGEQKFFTYSVSEDGLREIAPSVESNTKNGLEEDVMIERPVVGNAEVFLDPPDEVDLWYINQLTYTSIPQPHLSDSVTFKPLIGMSLVDTSVQYSQYNSLKAWLQRKVQTLWRWMWPP